MAPIPPTPLTPNAPVTGWSIVSQTEQIGLGPDGRAASGMLVSFQTGRGVRSSVFVPHDQYTPVNVRAAIAAKAAQLDEVQAMTG